MAITLNEISRTQITKIHIAKQQLGLNDQQYRDILSGFINADGQPCSSCKELNSDQAEVFLTLLKRMGWKEKQNGKTKKYEQFNGREGGYASPGQMRKIDGMWFTSPNVREKNEKAMNNFIRHITGVDHISFLLKKDVNKVIKAIEVL